tara:strand:- start:142 stop:360 length:219 start_codon:yes stop_codon:yes gene_type:complete
MIALALHNKIILIITHPRETGLFKEKRFEEALDGYEEAASFIEEIAASLDVWTACKLNAAQCALSSSVRDED